jgi:hypothetical protein
MTMIAGVAERPKSEDSACPPSTMLEAKNPTYMKITRVTTSRLPWDPNCARVWSIWGTPICGPCAACRAITTPPTTLPRASAAKAAQIGRP